MSWFKYTLIKVHSSFRSILAFWNALHSRTIVYNRELKYWKFKLNGKDSKLTEFICNKRYEKLNKMTVLWAVLSESERIVLIFSFHFVEMSLKMNYVRAKYRLISNKQFPWCSRGRNRVEQGCRSIQKLVCTKVLEM